MSVLDKLRGGDLRSIGRSNEENERIKALKRYLTHKSKIVRVSAIVIFDHLFQIALNYFFLAIIRLLIIRLLTF